MKSQTRLTPMMREALRRAANPYPETRMVRRSWIPAANRLVQCGFCTLHRLDERKRWFQRKPLIGGAESSSRAFAEGLSCQPVRRGVKPPFMLRVPPGKSLFKGTSSRELVT